MTPLDEREADARVEAVRQSVREGRPENLRSGSINPREIQEAHAEMRRGAERRADEWRQVMERHGFRWFEPAELDRTIGPLKYIPPQIEGQPNTELYWTKPHEVGQWRRPPSHRDPMAMTVDDLIGLYRTPEVFAEFIERRDSERAAARMGIKLAKKLPGR